MLKFRPISYADSDLRAVKFSAAASSVLEGHFCYTKRSDTHTVYATPITSAYTIATLPAFPDTNTGATVVTYGIAKGMYYPIYREDPDIENIGATISAGDYCIAFNLRPGQEFEIHYSAIGTGLKYFSNNELVGIDASGLLTVIASASQKALIVGAAMATLNGTWLRIRTI